MNAKMKVNGPVDDRYLMKAIEGSNQKSYFKSAEKVMNVDVKNE